MSVVFAVVCAATKASSAAPMAAKMASDSAGGPRSCDAGGGGASHLRDFVEEIVEALSGLAHMKLFVGLDVYVPLDVSARG